MAHDGQHDLVVSTPVLENVLDLARETIEPLEILNRKACLLYTSPSPRDRTRSRMPSSA